MIRAEFYKSKGLLTGFCFSGHSGYAEAGKDIVCAAVSSAVELTANMIEIFDYSLDVFGEENELICKVNNSDESSSNMLMSLKLHLEGILEEFPNTIKIIISEV